MSSGLLPIVANDALVFFRSCPGDTAGRGGDATFFSVVFRESQEKGLDIFLDGSGGGGIVCFSGAEGGGGKFTGGMVPDRPRSPMRSRGGNFGSSVGGDDCTPFLADSIIHQHTVQFQCIAAL
jgi:hypothetical protein